MLTLLAFKSVFTNSYYPFSYLYVGSSESCSNETDKDYLLDNELTQRPDKESCLIADSILDMVKGGSRLVVIPIDNDLNLIITSAPSNLTIKSPSYSNHGVESVNVHFGNSFQTLVVDGIKVNFGTISSTTVSNLYYTDPTSVIPEYGVSISKAYWFLKEDVDVNLNTSIIFGRSSITLIGTDKVVNIQDPNCLMLFAVSTFNLERVRLTLGSSPYQAEISVTMDQESKIAIGDNIVVRTCTINVEGDYELNIPDVRDSLRIEHSTSKYKSQCEVKLNREMSCPHSLYLSFVKMTGSGKFVVTDGCAINAILSSFDKKYIKVADGTNYYKFSHSYFPNTVIQSLYATSGEVKLPTTEFKYPFTLEKDKSIGAVTIRSDSFNCMDIKDCEVNFEILEKNAASISILLRDEKGTYSLGENITVLNEVIRRGSSITFILNSQRCIYGDLGNVDGKDLIFKKTVRYSCKIEFDKFTGKPKSFQIDEGIDVVINEVLTLKEKMPDAWRHQLSFRYGFYALHEGSTVTFKYLNPPTESSTLYYNPEIIGIPSEATFKSELGAQRIRITGSSVGSVFDNNASIVSKNIFGEYWNTFTLSQGTYHRIDKDMNYPEFLMRRLDCGNAFIEMPNGHLAYSGGNIAIKGGSYDRLYIISGNLHQTQDTVRVKALYLAQDTSPVVHLNGKLTVENLFIPSNPRLSEGMKVTNSLHTMQSSIETLFSGPTDRFKDIKHLFIQPFSFQSTESGISVSNGILSINGVEIPKDVFNGKIHLEMMGEIYATYTIKIRKGEGEVQKIKPFGIDIRREELRNVTVIFDLTEIGGEGLFTGPITVATEDGSANVNILYLETDDEEPKTKAPSYFKAERGSFIPDCSNSLSGGAIAGIVIGCIVFVAIIVIIVVIVVVKKKKGDGKPQSESAAA